MKNRKQTSRSIATLAGETLRDPKTSKRARTLAASALAQAPTTRRSTTPRARKA